VKYPELVPLFPSKQLKSNINDLDISPDSANIAFTLAKSLQVMGVAKGRILWNLDNTLWPTFDFRALKYIGFNFQIWYE
jgi:hypothetical protein